MVDKMVVWYYKPSNYDVQKEVVNNYTTASEDKPYEGVSKVTSNWTEINAGWWITDLEDDYKSTTRKSNQDWSDIYSSYWIDRKEYNAQKKKYIDYTAKVTLIEDTKEMYNAVKDLLDWNKENSSSGAWSRHSGTVDRATYDTITQGTATKNILGVFPKFDNKTATW
jgi:hypothetical protein